MDYNKLVCMLQLLSLCSVFAKVNGRDLVLTPKQDLQRNGKSLYYVEDVDRAKSMPIPWENTLKHVVFVTLFTNLATEAAAGNLSKLREYNNFVQSPYIRHNNSVIARFGDIITLAEGRLEFAGGANSDYRFIEGLCDYQCEKQDVVALWQIQKIRHRDAHRTYRYEMKYSVSPLRHPADLGAFKSRDELNFPRTRAQQVYIQKDDDYPQNFKHFNYDEGHQYFAKRRLDNKGERSFRQVSSYANGDFKRQATPIPQPTFLRSSFLPAPPSLAGPQRLNIGEYIKGYDGNRKQSTKMELWPNLVNRMSFHAPTTFRPAYDLKYLKPEIHQHATHTAGEVQFSDSDQQQTYSSVFSPPLVTHHFHHHFYMPPSEESNPQSIAADQHHQRQLHSPNNTHHTPGVHYQVPTPLKHLSPSAYHFMNIYEHPPSHAAPQKLAIPIDQQEEEEPPLVLKQDLVQLPPAPTLRKPHFYEMIPISIGPKVPLFIYPAPVAEEENEENETTQRSGNKPFVQSEMLNVGTIRYSEPDPLYTQPAENNAASQLEMPFIQFQEQEASHTASYKSNSETPNAANTIQLPPPAKRLDVHGILESYLNNKTHDNISTVQSEFFSDHVKVFDQEQDSSSKNIKISTEKTSSSTVRTEATSTLESTASKTEASSSSSNGLNSLTTNTIPILKLNNINTLAITPSFLIEGGAVVGTEGTPGVSDQLIVEKSNNPLAEVTSGMNEVQKLSIEQNTMKMETSTSIEEVKNTPGTTTTMIALIHPNTSNPNDTFKQLGSHLFISTSTTQTPLRTLARIRLSQSRTTTQQPVLKWMPRRQENSSVRAKKQLLETEDNLIREGVTENALNRTNAENSARTVPADQIKKSGILNKMYEVLTQKSVSKSISIKIGNNGEEIPIIEDDAENVVHKKIE